MSKKSVTHIHSSTHTPPDLEVDEIDESSLHIQDLLSDWKNKGVVAKSNLIAGIKM